LRHPSHKVNGISRNPYVLPIFLGVVPKVVHIYPQLIPMVSRTRPRPTIGPAVMVGVLALALAASGVFLLDQAQASAPQSAGASHAPSKAGALGATAGQASVGLTTPYYQPPPAPDPSQPATVITSGADQPDPFMVVQRGKYFLFTSEGSEAANVPVQEASQIGHWGPVVDALPTLPAWAAHGFTWAPDVHRFGHSYVLYFTALLKGSSPDIQCIGDAVGTHLTGPYSAASTPIICQTTQGGSIDPRTFVDGDGTAYMTWKSDENSDVNGTSLTNIYSQPLSADGQHLLGQPTRIYGPDQAWQGRIVEAQDLIEVHGVYYMFYSGNWFNQPDYGIGVARCDGPLGPCADISPTPFLASNGQGQGPGEASLFADSSGIWLLYSPFYFTTGTDRPVAMARIGFGPTGPYLGPPDPTAVATASTATHPAAGHTAAGHTAAAHNAHNAH
jgi:Glycosyl hydrolases family 43